MCREPGFARRQKKNCLSVSSLLMIPFTDCFFNSVRHCNVFSFPTRPRIQDSLASLARRMRVACRINQLSGRRQKRRFQTGCRSRRSSDLPDFEDAFLCIAVEVGLEKRRYLLFASSAGAPHRNSDAQKAHCFQQAVTPEVAGRLQFQPAPPQIVMYPQK